jgi:Txe/YoeB family toxin of Txe-Axe toxin-antitoxin module
MTALLPGAQLLQPMEVEPMELTPEQEAEYAARSKEYSRRMMREHRIWQSDLATKLRLKKVRSSSFVSSFASTCSR